MPNTLKRHDDYGQREKRKLRRLARREVPEITTTSPPSRGGRKPFVVVMSAEDAGAHFERQKRAALLMAYLCGKDLGIDPPTVRLLMEISPAQAGDLVRRGSDLQVKRIDVAAAGVASDLIRIVLNWPTERVAHTTAHEVRHVAQPPDVRSEDERAEADAEAYAEDAMERLWPAAREKLPERSPEPTTPTTCRTR